MLLLYTAVMLVIKCACVKHMFSFLAGIPSKMFFSVFSVKIKTFIQTKLKTKLYFFHSGISVE